MARQMRRFSCSAPLVGAGTATCPISLLLPGKSALVKEVDEDSTAPRGGGAVWRHRLSQSAHPLTPRDKIDEATGNLDETILAARGLRQGGNTMDTGTKDQLAGA